MPGRAVHRSRRFLQFPEFHVFGILMRTVGVSFSVYVSNKIGAAGMGLYELIMSVYGLSVTLACSVRAGGGQSGMDFLPDFPVLSARRALG